MLIGCADSRADPTDIFDAAPVVIMGHGGCGGVAASLAGTGESVLNEFVAPWVSLLDSARDEVVAGGECDKQFALELAGVETSLTNLMSFPFVRDAVERGELMLHGAWFAIAHGRLFWRNPKTHEFEQVSREGAPLDY